MVMDMKESSKSGNKIIELGQVNYEKGDSPLMSRSGMVFGIEGYCPALMSCDYKDPLKVLITYEESRQ